jgi:uncharacterized protein
LKEEFELLLKLQMIDEKLKELDASRGTLPYEIKKLKQSLSEIITRRQEILDESQNGQQEVKNLEKTNEEYAARSKELQNDLFNFVSSNKEYEAVTQNIDSIKAKIGESDSRVLEILSRQEGNEAELQDLATADEEKNSELDQKSKMLENHMSGSRGKIDKLQKLRKSAVSVLKKPLYDHYERIRIMRDGRGVVPLTRGACGGCFQTVPPQQQAEIRSMRDLVICEICGRIIVSDRLEIELNLDE